MTNKSRLLAEPPYSACPYCGNAAFGLIGIGRSKRNIALSGCMECGATQARELPPVVKRVLYLDQSAVSNLMRIAESAHRREGHHTDFYRRLLVQLRRLVHLQAAICPQSWTHDQESALDDRIERALLTILRNLSAGVRFKHYRTIQNMQTAGVALAWQAELPFKFDRHASGGAFLSPVDAWMPHMRIVAHHPWARNEVEAMRAIRRETVRDMAPVYEHWQNESFDFDAHVAIETRKGYGQCRLNIFTEREARINAAANDKRSAYPADLKALTHCPVWLVITAMRRHARLSVKASLHKTVEFFLSDAIATIPHVYIMALLNAAVAREKRQSKKPPDRSDQGTASDFNAIATYLPYCDAMFLDHKCAEYLRQQPLATRLAGYGCRIFSIKSQTQFLDYLTDLEASVPEQQRILAEELYGSMPTDIS